MGLDRYRAKRDFEHTPEPTGGEPAAPDSALSFVVQQHDASRMHYDFRLELDGVLLSWAIPKGPSYDTADKRLAVHVEDHPIDYAGFEGTIPKGEYGGGSVIVWDRGTWEPVGDPHAALAKGDLKFVLHGDKLSGRWVLVRMKPRGNERAENWLLIKERDGLERPRSDYDVTAEEPRSVISGLTVFEIAEQPAAPIEDAPAPGPQPSPAALEAPVELALCTLVTTAPEGDAWLGEVKYDGYRLTIALEQGTARCFSRNGNDVTERFAHLARAATSLPAASALLDGEAVVFDDRGATDFGALQAALGTEPATVTFVAFDLLHLNGYDLRPLPSLARKDLLRTLLAGEGPTAPLRLAEYVTGDVPALLEVACAQGLEGVVAKRADAPYPRGRTRAWVKVKCRRSQEFVVLGFTEPGGARTGFGALLVGYHAHDGALVYAGRVGSGFSDVQLSEIHATLVSLERPTPPLSDPPRLPGAHWVEPRLVANVAFAEWTAEGVLRQPSFLGLRDDVDPATVVREVPEPPGLAPALDAPAEEAPAGAAAGGAAVAVLGVRVSNPSKQLFPASELTKLDLARYYEAIAPLMLHHVESRPLTLVRCPVGDGRGTCFYQRHPDKGLPASVQTVSYVLSGHAQADEWLYVSDAAGLVALAQMGVAEIHAWQSHVDAMLRPDRIVFDLDPGPQVEWAQIVDAAHVVREACADLGFTPFVKSTGSKGLHVVLPIEPVWEFERVRALTHAIADRIAAQHAAEFTAKMVKSQRTGRIFIDYVRNSEGASAVAPYSTRFLEGPPVAVPLTWDELSAAQDVRRVFTPSRVLERVRSVGDPWSAIDEASVGMRVLKAAEASVAG